MRRSARLGSVWSALTVITAARVEVKFEIVKAAFATTGARWRGAPKHGFDIAGGLLTGGTSQRR